MLQNNKIVENKTDRYTRPWCKQIWCKYVFDLVVQTKYPDDVHVYDDELLQLDCDYNTGNKASATRLR